MKPPEPTSSTTARHKHLNTAEAEETELKNNFIKTIKSLKK